MGILVGLALLALPASSALAAPAGAATGIQIGPLTVGNGYKVTISGGCNGPNAYVYVTAVKTGRGYTISHSYYQKGTKATSKCTTSSNYGSGTMSIKWGKPLSGKLKFSKAGKTRRWTVKGCKGTEGHLRKVTGKGTLKMAIHTGVLGKLDLHKVKSEILIYDGSCTGGGGAPSTALYAAFDKYKESVYSYVSPRGKRFVEVYGEDNLSHNVGGSVDDLFEGKSLFSFHSNLKSAKVVGFNPFLTGSLKYKASAACTHGYTAGRLTGKLALHDPLSGTYRFAGKKATHGSVTLINNKGKC